MNEWLNLCGVDGRVKARLNKRTGELVIKERGDYHRWNVLVLCGIDVVPQATYACRINICDSSTD